MPLAVTLRLDGETAVSVERIWQALAEQSGDDDALRLGYAPHLTLTIIPDADAITEVEKAVFELTDRWDALPLTLAGLGVFPAPSPVIWLAPVATEPLLARHEALYTALLPHPINPDYRPRAWVPHVTLSRGTRWVGRAVEVALSVWSGPIRGWGDRVDLVRFQPVEILRSQPLLLTTKARDGPQAIGTTTASRNSI
jgi:2'-5' RNA ligase